MSEVQELKKTVKQLQSADNEQVRINVFLRKPVHLHFTNSFDFFAGYPVSPDSVEATKTCY